MLSPESNNGTCDEDNKDDDQGKGGQHHQHHGIQFMVMVFTTLANKRTAGKLSILCRLYQPLLTGQWCCGKEGFWQ